MRFPLGITPVNFGGSKVRGFGVAKDQSTAELRTVAGTVFRLSYERCREISAGSRDSMRSAVSCVQPDDRACVSSV